jgi:hypothetical protein
MSKAKHTTGDWVVYERDHFGVYAEQERGEVLVASCGTTADALLIAAVPELLEALQMVAAWEGDKAPPLAMVRQWAADARAALAKARVA